MTFVINTKGENSFELRKNIEHELKAVSMIYTAMLCNKVTERGLDENNTLEEGKRYSSEIFAEMIDNQTVDGDIIISLALGHLMKLSIESCNGPLGELQLIAATSDPDQCIKANTKVLKYFRECESNKYDPMNLFNIIMEDDNGSDD